MTDMILPTRVIEQRPFPVPKVVSERARAWAHSIYGLDPPPQTADDLAVFIQSVMDDERQRALSIVELALVEAY